MNTRDDVFGRGDRPVAPTVVNMMMTSALKPYPAYKDSGVQWLGEVPAHWDVPAVKKHYAIQLGKMLQNKPNNRADVEVPYLKAQHVQWFHVRTTDAPTMWASGTDIDQFGIAPGDLLVCEGGEGGRCGILKQKVGGYIIQNALHRVRPRDQNSNDFLQYVMSAIATTGWFDALNDKATIAHFTREKFGALKIPLPPFPEQTAIVRFLDHADRRIRRYIRAKQKLIKLLEEQKKAIIHQAVTGQIDVRTGRPYPAYKDSGVEWLREIPKYWESRRFKTVCRIRYGLGQPPPESPNGLPLIRATNVERGRIIDKDLIYVDPSAVPAGREAILKEKEIIVVRSGAYTADSAMIPKVYDGAVSGYDMVVTVIGAQPEFVVMALLCTYLRDDQLIIASTRSAQPHLNAEELGASVLLLPSFSEQTAIVEFLDKATAAIDTSISRTYRQMEVLHEYRTRLIADVVTGKLDVREAAAALPEVDPLAEDDLDGTIHDGGNSNLGELDAEESAEEYTIEKEVTV